ncbi:hypothetical protein BDZ85DRAFT_268414 [Elsinoe ampelina]|uniref:Uncharacterized protein n=1 Tax=Elsinoe ampelina TaxID=302913 RepID=A0A6A6G151_9PEZI|nr:hypothetical protein BDZ85DRAFT_268414 [Elsinoe ampelina]
MLESCWMSFPELTRRPAADTASRLLSSMRRVHVALQHGLQGFLVVMVDGGKIVPCLSTRFKYKSTMIHGRAVSSQASSPSALLYHPLFILALPNPSVPGLDNDVPFNAAITLGTLAAGQLHLGCPSRFGSSSRKLPLCSSQAFDNQHNRPR